MEGGSCGFSRHLARIYVPRDDEYLTLDVLYISVDEKIQQLMMSFEVASSFSRKVSLKIKI